MANKYWVEREFFIERDTNTFGHHENRHFFVKEIGSDLTWFAIVHLKKDAQMVADALTNLKLTKRRGS